MTHGSCSDRAEVSEKQRRTTQRQGSDSLARRGSPLVQQRRVYPAKADGYRLFPCVGMGAWSSRVFIESKQQGRSGGIIT